MAEYKPLFPKETQRTRQYRRVIIRKTLQIVRSNPDLKDEEIIMMAEKEAVKVCDLCVESSFEDEPKPLVGQYFLNEADGQRREHVGRLFLHKLDGHLRKGNLKECLIPVFCQSVLNLLGQEMYEVFAKRAEEMIVQMNKKGIVYNDMLDTPPALALMDEIIAKYKQEMKKSGSFADQLKNQIDTALVDYQRENPAEEFDIEKGVCLAYQDFVQLMGLNE